MERALLPLMEDFYTIQGEGFYTGTAAYFIRLGGCDVGCVWCDVKESWNAADHPPKTVTEIIAPVINGNIKTTVITGGEPLMYNLDKLTQSLNTKGVRTHIETSGVYPLTGSWHWICFSPKKFKKPRLEFYEKANELKVVVFNKSDFAWAEEHAKQVNPNCKLYLQPEWDKKEEILPLVIDYVKGNPKWSISLQTHKYINVP